MIKKIFAETLFTGTQALREHTVSYENGIITSIEAGLADEGITQVPFLSAGFNDIHINGGERFHFTDKADYETVGDINDSSLKLGTAYTLPALITSSTDNIYKGIDAVRQYRKENPDSGILGIHLEGPFLNPAKRGAHIKEFVRKPLDKELGEIISYGRDVIKMITVAPEVLSPDQLEMLTSSGIIVSAGHSDATYEQASAAFGSGVKLVTHLYNAMSPLLHRNPGLVGATFDHDEVYAPIILDGIHCDFPAARIAYKIKREKLFLISDALFTGGKVERFEWLGFNAYLINGQYINSEGNLAGANIALADAVRNAVNEVQIPLQEAVEMATLRPAKALKLDDTIGKIEPGYPAVFTAFDHSLLNFRVVK